MKMTPEEAINAATINGAYAMGISKHTWKYNQREKSKSHRITKPISSFYQLPYAFGSNLIDQVIIEGKSIS
jgi:imidazolonepropionase